MNGAKAVGLSAADLLTDPDFHKQSYIAKRMMLRIVWPEFAMRPFDTQESILNTPPADWVKDIQGQYEKDEDRPSVKFGVPIQARPKPIAAPKPVAGGPPRAGAAPGEPSTTGRMFGWVERLPQVRVMKGLLGFEAPERARPALQEGQAHLPPPPAPMASRAGGAPEQPLPPAPSAKPAGETPQQSPSPDFLDDIGKAFARGIAKGVTLESITSVIPGVRERVRSILPSDVAKLTDEKSQTTAAKVAEFVGQLAGEAPWYVLAGAIIPRALVAVGTRIPGLARYVETALSAQRGLEIVGKAKTEAKIADDVAKVVADHVAAGKAVSQRAVELAVQGAPRELQVQAMAAARQAQAMAKAVEMAYKNPSLSHVLAATSRAIPAASTMAAISGVESINRGEDPWKAVGHAFLLASIAEPLRALPGLKDLPEIAKINVRDPKLDDYLRAVGAGEMAGAILGSRQQQTVNKLVNQYIDLHTSKAAGSALQSMIAYGLASAGISAATTPGDLKERLLAGGKDGFATFLTIGFFHIPSVAKAIMARNPSAQTPLDMASEWIKLTRSEAEAIIGKLAPEEMVRANMAAMQYLPGGAKLPGALPIPGQAGLITLPPPPEIIKPHEKGIVIPPMAPGERLLVGPEAIARPAMVTPDVRMDVQNRIRTIARMMRSPNDPIAASIAEAVNRGAIGNGLVEKALRVGVDALDPLEVQALDGILRDMGIDPTPSAFPPPTALYTVPTVTPYIKSKIANPSIVTPQGVADRDVLLALDNARKQADPVMASTAEVAAQAAARPELSQLGSAYEIYFPYEDRIHTKEDLISAYERARAFNVPVKTAPGADITTPYWYYSDAIKDEANPERAGKNVWLRQSESASNDKRVLLVEFSGKLVKPLPEEPPREFMDPMSGERIVPRIPPDFPEPPPWIATIVAENPRGCDVYIVRDIDEAKRFINSAGYPEIITNITDANAPIAENLLDGITVGVAAVGYGEEAKRLTLKYGNVTGYATPEQLTTPLSPPVFGDVGVAGGVRKRIGTYMDYRHFEGTRTIPRLKIQEYFARGGAKKMKGFGKLPSGAFDRSYVSILSGQVDEILRTVKTPLIYLTSGERMWTEWEHYSLPDVYKLVKQWHPDFQGFIVRSDAIDLERVSPELIQASGIKYIEMDPAPVYDKGTRQEFRSIRTLNKAFANATRGGASIIIDLQLPAENLDRPRIEEIVNWIKDRRSLISHVNVIDWANARRSITWKEALYPGYRDALAQGLSHWAGLDDLRSQVFKHVAYFTNQALARDRESTKLLTEALYGVPTESITEAAPGGTPVEAEGGTRLIFLGTKVNAIAAGMPLEEVVQRHNTAIWFLRAKERARFSSTIPELDALGIKYWFRNTLGYGAWGEVEPHTVIGIDRTIPPDVANGIAAILGSGFEQEAVGIHMLNPKSRNVAGLSLLGTVEPWKLSMMANEAQDLGIDTSVRTGSLSFMNYGDDPKFVEKVVDLITRHGFSIQDLRAVAGGSYLVNKADYGRFIQAFRDYAAALGRPDIPDRLLAKVQNAATTAWGDVAERVPGAPESLKRYSGADYFQEVDRRNRQLLGGPKAVDPVLVIGGIGPAGATEPAPGSPGADACKEAWHRLAKAVQPNLPGPPLFRGRGMPFAYTAGDSPIREWLKRVVDDHYGKFASGREYSRDILAANTYPSQDGKDIRLAILPYSDHRVSLCPHWEFRKIIKDPRVMKLDRILESIQNMVIKAIGAENTYYGGILGSTDTYGASFTPEAVFGEHPPMVPTVTFLNPFITMEMAIYHAHLGVIRWEEVPYYWAKSMIDTALEEAYHNYYSHNEVDFEKLKEHAIKSFGDSFDKAADEISKRLVTEDDGEAYRYLVNATAVLATYKRAVMKAYARNVHKVSPTGPYDPSRVADLYAKCMIEGLLPENIKKISFLEHELRPKVIEMLNAQRQKQLQKPPEGEQRPTEGEQKPAEEGVYEIPMDVDPEDLPELRKVIDDEADRIKSRYGIIDHIAGYIRDRSITSVGDAYKYFISQPTSEQYGKVTRKDFNDLWKAAQIQAIRSIPDLQPEYAEDLTAADLVRVYHVMTRVEPMIEVLERLSKAGRITKGWYRRQAKVIEMIAPMLPGPYDGGTKILMFAKLIASLSPNQPVRKNFLDALRIWHIWAEPDAVAHMYPHVTSLSLVRPYVEDPDILRRMMVDTETLKRTAGEDARGTLSMRSHTNNVITVFSTKGAGELSGYKVRAFWRNLMGYLNWTTIDTHMGTPLGMTEGELQSKHNYIAASTVIRRAAKNIGYEPAEGQETVWSPIRTITELIVRRRMPIEKAIKTLSPRLLLDYGANAEFYHLLLEDPDVKLNLEALGIHDAVRKVTRDLQKISDLGRDLSSAQKIDPRILSPVADVLAGIYRERAVKAAAERARRGKGIIQEEAEAEGNLFPEGSPSAPPLPPPPGEEAERPELRPVWRATEPGRAELRQVSRSEATILRRLPPSLPEKLGRPADAKQFIQEEGGFILPDGRLIPIHWVHNLTLSRAAGVDPREMSAVLLPAIAKYGMIRARIGFEGLRRPARLHAQILVPPTEAQMRAMRQIARELPYSDPLWEVTNPVNNEIIDSGLGLPDLSRTVDIVFAGVGRDRLMGDVVDQVIRGDERWPAAETEGTTQKAKPSARAELMTVRPPQQPTGPALPPPPGVPPAPAQAAAPPPGKPVRIEDALPDVARVFEAPPKPSWGQSFVEYVKQVPRKIQTHLTSEFQPLAVWERKVRKAAGLPAKEWGTDAACVAEGIYGAAAKAELDVRNFEAAIAPIKDYQKEFDYFLFLVRTRDRIMTDPEKRKVGDWDLQKVDQNLAALKRFLPPGIYQKFEEIGLNRIGPDGKVIRGAYQEAMDRALRLQVDAGLMSHEVYEKIRSMNDIYAPFAVMKYIDQATETDPRTGSPAGGRAMATAGHLTYAIQGISDPDFRLGGILHASAEQIYRSRILAEKNRIMRRIASIATIKVPDNPFEIVSQPVYLPPSAPGQKGHWLGPNHHALPKDKGLLPFRINGEIYGLVVPKDVEGALQGLNYQQADYTDKMLRAFQSGMRAGATTYNISFQAVNAFLDATRLALISRYGIRSPIDLPVFVMDWFHGLASSISGNFGEGNYLYKLALEKGVLNSTIQRIITPEKFYRPERLSPIEQKAGPIVKAGRWLLDSAAAFANAIEEATKLTGLRRALRMESFDNLSHSQKLEQWDRIRTEIRRYSGSPDFARSTPDSRRFNLLMMFFNAKLQDAASDLSRLAGKGGRLGDTIAAWTRIAISSLPIVGLALLNHSDEYLKDYEEIPRWEKDNYFMIPRDSYFTTDDGRKIRDYYRIPKRGLLQMVDVMVNDLCDFMKGSTEGNPFNKLAADFFETWAPINIEGKNMQERAESVVSTLNPLLRLPVEQIFNRDTWRHRDIISQRLARFAAPEQYRASTPEVWKELGKMTGLSPVRLQQAVSTLTAGLITQFAMNKPVGERSWVTEAPILKRLVRSVFTTDEIGESYLNKLIEQQGSDSAVLSRTLEELWEGIKLRPKEEQARIIAELVRVGGPQAARLLRQIMREDRLGLTYHDRQMLRLGVADWTRARFIAFELQRMADPNKQQEWMQELRKKRILTPRVAVQVQRLLKGAEAQRAALPGVVETAKRFGLPAPP